MKKLPLVLAISVFVSACGGWSVGLYSVSNDNVAALRSFNGKTVNLGAFTTTEAERGQIDCRGAGPITTQDRETFAEFIRKAMLDELRLAGVYSSTAPVTIAGNLDVINFSSNDGYWELRLTIRTSTGRTMTVSEPYEYEYSAGSDSDYAMCRQTSRAFVPAVQNLIGKIVRSPDFASLMSQ